MTKFILHPGHLKITDLRILLDEKTQLELHHDAKEAINASEKMVAKMIDSGKIIYGINTGFGALSSTKIKITDLHTLQHHLVLSHAAGTGPLLPDDVVRLILALKINSLARGFSGIRMETIQALIKLYHANIYPCIPSQGSVGASGDLAPLAHLSAVLLGEGEARYQGKIISAKEALKKINLKPLTLAPKEGLALLNGTQVSTALALYALLCTEDVFIAALITGALSVDASKSSVQPFDERIQHVRGHQTQIKVAKILRELLHHSEIAKSHINCEKIQDPYSLRCQPQVMGACLSQLLYAVEILIIEANAVSDNPLIFTKDGVILSGGNFHAEPVAFVADILALFIT